MTKFFFGPFPQFLGQKFFHEIELLCKLLKGFWHHAKIQRILMIQLQENTQMLEGKGGQTLFHRILPATTMGLTSKTAVNWHLKVKDIEYIQSWSYQKALHHSQHAKNQPNS